MKIRAFLAVGFFLVTAPAFGQVASVGACTDDLTKLGGVRMSTALNLAEKKRLPDVSDLKHSKIESDVVVKVVIGKDGVLLCAEATEGDSQLWARSIEAAKQWRFRPYTVNGEPVIVHTRIRFAFRKGRVSVE